MNIPSCFGDGIGVLHPQYVAEAQCADCPDVKSCYEKSERRYLMKEVDEARVLKKYLTVCGACGGKTTIEMDERIFICDTCYGIGVTIRKNKTRAVKALLAKKIPAKDKTYVR